MEGITMHGEKRESKEQAQRTSSVELRRMESGANCPIASPRADALVDDEGRIVECCLPKGENLADPAGEGSSPETNLLNVQKPCSVHSVAKGLKADRGKTPMHGAAEPVSSEDTRPIPVSPPHRTGKWFIVHRNTLATVRYLRSAEIWSEFLEQHPNADDEARDILGIELDDNAIHEHASQICIASYRWEKVKKDRYGRLVPANYGWFLRTVRDRGLIGWVDWMANLAVGVDVSETMQYMGELYATNTCLADWMFNPVSFNPALSRCWIFQETAFGKLDAGGMQNLLCLVSELGQRVRGGDFECLVGEYIDAVTSLAKLVSRRGWTQWIVAYKARRGLPEISDYSTSSSGTSAPLELRNLGRADLLLRRMAGDASADAIPQRGSAWINEAELQSEAAYPRSWAQLQQLAAAMEAGRASSGTGPFLHILDFFTRAAEDNRVAPLVLRLATSCPHAECPDFTAFTDQFGLGLLRAYAGCAVSYESDREAAITSVGRAIALGRGMGLDEEAFMEAMWAGAVRGACAGGAGSFQLNVFDPAIAHGRELWGLGTLSGAVVRGGKYNTPDGEFDTEEASGHGANHFPEFVYQEHGGWVHGVDGTPVEMVICNPPRQTRADGLLKLVVVLSTAPRRVIRACALTLRNGHEPTGWELWPEAACEVEVVAL